MAAASTTRGGVSSLRPSTHTNVPLCHRVPWRLLGPSLTSASTLRNGQRGPHRARARRPLSSTSTNRLAPPSSRGARASLVPEPPPVHSTTSAPNLTPSLPPASAALALAERLGLPRFRLPASRLRLLSSPTDFYSTLLDRISRARERIFLSTLYIGKDETELMDRLREALQRSPTLVVHILVDALRATREGPYLPAPDPDVLDAAPAHDADADAAPAPRPSRSCASLLAALARDFPNRVELRGYRAPGLPAWLERLVGKRLVEGWGLQHMKVYGFDDEVLLSGANLSRDYFTNRQDRYLLVGPHRPLAGYLHSLLLLVSRFSYLLVPDAGAGASPPGGVVERHHAPYALHWDGGTTCLLGESASGTVEPAGASSVAVCDDEEAGAGSGGATSTAGGKSRMAPVGTTPGTAASLFQGLERNWARHATEEIRCFTQRWRSHSLAAEEGERRAQAERAADAAAESPQVVLVPLIQVGPLSIRDETDAVPLLADHLCGASLSSSSSAPLLDLTTGYFALSPPYRDLVVSPPTPPRRSSSSSSSSSSPNDDAAAARLGVRLVAASPRANGFFGSRGISRFVPDAYTQLERRFWSRLRRAGRTGGEVATGVVGVREQKQGEVEMREWFRPGWTYHAKGLWARTSYDAPPHFTLLGSSNFGRRSAQLDLECTFAIECLPSRTADGAAATATTTTTTTEEETHPFAAQLDDEVARLRSHATDVVDDALFRRPDRRVPWGVRIALPLLQRML